MSKNEILKTMLPLLDAPEIPKSPSPDIVLKPDPSMNWARYKAFSPPVEYCKEKKWQKILRKNKKKNSLLK